MSEELRGAGTRRLLVIRSCMLPPNAAFSSHARPPERVRDDGECRRVVMAAASGRSVVSRRPLNDSNRQAVEALLVAPSQERFVSRVADSILEAAEHPAAHALYWAVYAEDTPVGFVVIADDVDRPDYVPQYLWKLIDERYQRWGFGTATLDLIVE